MGGAGNLSTYIAIAHLHSTDFTNTKTVLYLYKVGQKLVYLLVQNYIQTRSHAAHMTDSTYFVNSSPTLESTSWNTSLSVTAGDSGGQKINGYTNGREWCTVQCPSHHMTPQLYST